MKKQIRKYKYDCWSTALLKKKKGYCHEIKCSWGFVYYLKAEENRGYFSLKIHFLKRYSSFLIKGNEANPSLTSHFYHGM